MAHFLPIFNVQFAPCPNRGYNERGQFLSYVEETFEIFRWCGKNAKSAPSVRGKSWLKASRSGVDVESVFRSKLWFRCPLGWNNRVSPSSLCLFSFPSLV